MTILTGITIGPLLRPLRRVFQLRRTHGTARVCYAILCRIAALPVIRRCIQLCAVDYWRLQLDGAGPPPRLSHLFTVRLAQSADIPELAQYFGDRERIETRLARNDRCVVAVCQGSIGAAVWLTLGPGQFLEDWNELRCAFHFPAGIAWSYDGKGTRLGAWGTMMKQLPGFLRDLNVQEIDTVIDCNNWQSIDAHRSLGYVSAGVLLHARIFGIRWRLFKPHGKRLRRVPTAVERVEIAERS